MGAKTCEFWVSFLPLQTLIANISGLRQYIQKSKTTGPRGIPNPFNEKSPVNVNWSTNYLELHASLDPLNALCWGDCISAPRRCCALKFLHALEFDHTLLAHTPSGAGVPPPKNNRENLKFGLQFSVSESITSGLWEYPHETFSVDVARGRGDNVGTIFGRPAPKNLLGPHKIRQKVGAIFGNFRI